MNGTQGLFTKGPLTLEGRKGENKTSVRKINTVRIKQWRHEMEIITLLKIVRRNDLVYKQLFFLSLLRLLSSLRKWNIRLLFWCIKLTKINRKRNNNHYTHYVPCVSSWFLCCFQKKKGKESYIAAGKQEQKQSKKTRTLPKRLRKLGFTAISQETNKLEKDKIKKKTYLQTKPKNQNRKRKLPFAIVWI